jgi:selenophosphate synthetase-related protein
MPIRNLAKEKDNIIGIQRKKKSEKAFSEKKQKEKS